MRNFRLRSCSLHARGIRNIVRIEHAVTFRTIYTQGCGIFGSLGQGDDLMDSPSFEKLNLSGTPNHKVKIKNISAGWCHSAAVTSDGQLVIFGRPYDDITIRTMNRLRTLSPTLGRFYGIILLVLNNSDRHCLEAPFCIAPTYYIKYAYATYFTVASFIIVLSR